MSTSSEKYEVAQDEVEALVAKLTSTIRDTEAAQGEAKKRLVQVGRRSLKEFLHYDKFGHCSIIALIHLENC